MKKETNILFTSVGRRSYLIRYFKEALRDRGKVYVTNSTKYSTVFHYADGYEVSPLIYSEEYIPFLAECCRKWNIGALISLFDIDLYVLAKNRKVFDELGVKLLVSDASVVEICNDKWRTFRFLKAAGIETPKTYLEIEEAVGDIKKGLLRYPLVVKPRWGMGSIGIFEADDEEELRVFVRKTQKLIMNSYLKYESVQNLKESVLIQEKIEGQEYGLDVINDLNSEYITTVSKKKIGMRSGETDCAVTVIDTDLEVLGHNISSRLKHIMNLDVDVLESEKNYYVLEMNARFGGGYPFSHVAGLNLPAAMIDWIEGNEPEPGYFSVKESVLAQKELQIQILQET